MDVLIKSVEELSHAIETAKGYQDQISFSKWNWKQAYPHITYSSRTELNEFFYSSLPVLHLTVWGMILK